MELESIFKELKLSIYDRLGSPLLSAFVISWCLWNYKFFVILFSDAGVTQTFELIQRICFPDLCAQLSFGFVLPALTTAAYFFAYPIPARYIYRLTKRHQQELVDISNEEQRKSLLSEEDSLRLYNKIRELELQHADQLKQRDEINTQLQSRIDLMIRDKGVKPASSDLPPVDKTAKETPPFEELDKLLSEEEFRALSVIGSNTHISQADLLHKLQMKFYAIQTGLEHLQELGLILPDQEFWSATKPGRLYLKWTDDQLEKNQRHDE